MRTVSATKNRILLYGLDWFTEQHDAGMVCVKGNVRYRDAVYEGAAFCRLVASAAADAGAFGEFVRELNGCFAIVLQRDGALCAATDRLRSFPLCRTRFRDAWLVTDDLLRAILYWVVFLYLLLLLTTISLTVWVFHRSMRPLYELLRWLDDYTPGRRGAPVPCSTRIVEFRRLSAAAQQAVDRSEALFEQQKHFIGNASHELQTPLAVLGNRIEWLLDNTEPTEKQMEELLKMQRTLRQIVRLNKTLLLLTKIDNGQFPESSEVDLAAVVGEQVALYDEIYAGRGIACTVSAPEAFVVRMNESLASTLVTNLLKNAYLHTAEGGAVGVELRDRTLTVTNDGTAPLDAEHIFERFYQGARKEGSTGLGLALVSAVGRYYGLRIDYRFEGGRHRFSVRWP